MNSKDYLPMPELINSEYKVYLSFSERQDYEKLKKEYVLTSEITAANAAIFSGKLAQLANGAIYKDSGEVEAIHERKLDALEDIIEAANGKPLLIAYCFNHDLKRILERLSNLKVNYACLKSTDSIKCWNEGKLQVACFCWTWT